jgi:hypothetical protein
LNKLSITLVLFQYRDPDVVSKIKQVSGNSIHSALDTYSEGGSQEITVNILGPGTGKLVTILDPSEEAQKLRPDVVVERKLTHCFQYLKLTVKQISDMAVFDFQHPMDQKRG